MGQNPTKILCIKFKLAMNFLPPTTGKTSRTCQWPKNSQLFSQATQGFQTDMDKNLPEAGLKGITQLIPVTSPSTAVLANTSNNCHSRTCPSFLGHSSSPCLDRDFSFKSGFVPTSSFTPSILCPSMSLQGHQPVGQRGSVALERSVLHNPQCLQPAALPAPLVTSLLTWHTSAQPAEEEHMGYLLISGIIPSLPERDRVILSFQSINYSCFIVSYYSSELLQIKSDRIFRCTIWFHLPFLTAWWWFQAPFCHPRICSS